MFLDRRQRARLAVYLASPRLLLFWIKAMAGMVVMTTGLMLASFFFPQHTLSPIQWAPRIITTINFIILGGRWWALRQGWLPVSQEELERPGLALSQQSVETQGTLLQLSREHGWLTWKEIWPVMGGRPTLGDPRWGCGWRWTDGTDRLAQHRDFLAGVRLEARRRDKGLAPMADGLSMKARVRARC